MYSYPLADYNQREVQHVHGLLPSPPLPRRFMQWYQDKTEDIKPILIISWLDYTSIFVYLLQNFRRDTNKFHFHSEFYLVWQPKVCCLISLQEELALWMERVHFADGLQQWHLPPSEAALTEVMFFQELRLPMTAQLVLKAEPPKPSVVTF